jgi:hypothetical protein
MQAVFLSRGLPQTPSIFDFEIFAILIAFYPQSGKKQPAR